MSPNYNAICEHGFPAPCRECDLRSELSAARAEIESLKIIDKYRTSKTPWLCDEVQRLKAENKRMREALAGLFGDCIASDFNDSWDSFKIAKSALGGEA